MAEDKSNNMGETDLLEDRLDSELDGSIRDVALTSSKSIREILREMFEPSEYVKLHNPFKYSMGWVYATPEKQPKPEQISTATKRVYHGVQDKRILKPGDSIAVLGGEAYVAIERMYKRYVQIEGDVITMFNNTEDMYEFIPKVYKGKVDVAELVSLMDRERANNNGQPVIDPIKVDAMRQDIADDIEDLGFAEEGEPKTAEASGTPEPPREIKFKKPVGRPPKSSK